MIERKRALARVLAVVMLAAVILSSCFIAVEADHNCRGENCRICAVINTCLENLKNTVSGSGTAVLAVGSVFFSALVVFSLFSRGYFSTPVELKVKISN